MLNPNRGPGERRRGVILLVVLAMITLLAILGITFVMQADATATSARIFREAQTRSGFSNLRDIIVTDASLSWDSFLGQLLYDVNDDASGILSALRGHSLARTMYGWNPASTHNDRPWTGTGRLAEATAMGTGDGLVNYQYSSSSPTFLRDPGRMGVRASTTAPLGAITGDVNVPYTYPDRHNMFLASIDPATSTVLARSYHRDEVGGALTAGAPNWTSADGKYRLMRPRPADMGAGFPYPSDPGGDVKNLDWAPGGNDSVWIDFNAPVKTFEGRKYKCLVAPLVLEMDGRVNLQTAGNILGPTGNEHASNQGWGPWEVNLRHVLTANATEWKQVFTGNGTVAGKYGAAQRPSGPPVPGGTTVGARYPIDFNGIVDPPGALALSGAFAFPGASGLRPYQTFPGYPAGSYGSGAFKETTTTGDAAGAPNHPSIYNVFRPDRSNPANLNRNFPVSDLAALLRLHNLGGKGLPSDILTLLASNLNDGSNTANGSNGAYRRNLVTTLSMDLDRPGSPPYAYDRNADGQAYTFKPGATPDAALASAAAQPFPGTIKRGTTPPNTEFDPTTWKSNLPGLRIDLKRQLANYPTPDLTTWRFTDAQKPQVAAAVGDRQQLAREIFERLRLVTGAMTTADALNAGITVDGTAGGVTSPQFRALRWLAQHAVNLVDFIDNDDYSTPFQFHPGQWAYGAEAPRLVINETYAQWDNDRATLEKPDAGKNEWRQPVAGNYRVNVWAELHNPSRSDANHPENGTARLHNGTNSTDGWAMYRLRLSDKHSADLRTPENATGADDAGVISTRVDYWGSTDATRTVKPGAGVFKETTAKGNNGFLVVGPDPDYNVAASTQPSLSLTDPGLAAVASYLAVDGPPPPAPAMAAQRMTYVKSVTVNPTTGNDRPALFLEKLANPYLPENTDTTSPLYNPYITVDYVERLRVEDGRLYNHTTAIEPPVAPNVVIADRKSIGKWHPLAGGQNFLLPAAPAVPPANQPQHTFFRHNSVDDVDPPVASAANQTLQVPFDTFVHLDRIPTSIGELMHVSAVRPHELTQQFMTGSPGLAKPLAERFQHRARFSEEATRLHRLLDHVTVSPWAGGVALGGRIPGKVNINAIRDQKVFNALCDAVAANQFTQAEVDELWAELAASRAPAAPNGEPRPFWSLAMGQAAGGDELSAAGRGLGNTLLRPRRDGGGTIPAPASDSTQQRMLEAAAAFNSGTYPGGQPLRRFELMSKLLGNLTTRSNVFGVWATVGFFEVTDDTTSPVKLGAEINWPSLGVIRHRMFAIVDRTQMQSFPTLDDRSRPMCNLAAPVAPSVDPTTRAPLPASFYLRNADNVVLGNATAVSNVDTGRDWRPEVGALLTFDPDTDNEETVEAVAVDKGTAPNMWAVQAVFRKSHGAGAAVINRGNPGPWLRYDPRRDAAVVPYSIVFE